ncbi:hypothetical protein T03_13344 [Trichinella britovi]|uniref:Uncharacterized protein n=1 Tax=Trichinella britovi TaxID=45882 RepID=A0A0V1CR00_TRIBR|nr:hypothetical protein T03_13344 [Trichinella britovi]
MASTARWISFHPVDNVTAVFSLSRMRKKIQLKCYITQLKAACSIFARQWPKLAGNIFCPKIKNKCEGGETPYK